MEYAGDAEEFCACWDKLLFTLEAEDPEPYREAFLKLAPDCEYEIRPGELLAYDVNGVYGDMRVFFGGVAEAGLCPAAIRRNRPNIGNAVKKALLGENGGVEA